jgi:hypothetical protein
MLDRRLRFTFWVVLAACAGCPSNQSDAEPDASAQLDASTEPDGLVLGASHPQGLPAGNATGNAFEGVYWTPSPRTPAPVECDCRVGTCPPALEELSHTGPWQLKQHDGRLDIGDRVGVFAPPCQGGIDADGSFWCGSENDRGELVALIHGKVSGAGAERVIEFSAEQRHTDNDGRYACDARFEDKFGIF